MALANLLKDWVIRTFFLSVALIEIRVIEFQIFYYGNWMCDYRMPSFRNICRYFMKITIKIKRTFSDQYSLIMTTTTIKNSSI